MGCFGRDGESYVVFKPEHQWSYLNLSDFTASSFLTPLSYGILYISLAISIACYLVDVFTCSQLLLFDKWSGKIQPAVPLYISRWVFTGAILLSFVLLAYRWWKAVRAIKTGGITQSYLDPLAVRLQSVRMGKQGRGWRRFLVFAELTKSKKGVEYVALFTYYSFEASVRIIFAEGPRQVINAITLAALMKDNVVPVGDHAASQGNSPVGQFFVNLRAVAQEDNLRAAVLFGMLFTVIIWLFAFLSLCIACILWVVFLWHHIPAGDSLRKFCKRKIETRLQSIVDTTVKKALAKEDMRRARQASRDGDYQPLLKKQPTLPQLDEKLLETPSLSRQTTFSTLPEYPGPPASHDPMPTFPNPTAFQARPPPTRTATQSSKMSSGTAMTAPPRGMTPRLPLGPPGVSRSATGASAQSLPVLPSGRIMPLRNPVRQNTAPPSSTAQRYPPPSRGLSAMSNRTPPRGAGPLRQDTQSSMGSYRGGATPAGLTRQPTLPFVDPAHPPPPAATYGGGYPPASAPAPFGASGRFLPYNPAAATTSAGPAPSFSRPTGSRGSSVYSTAPAGGIMAPALATPGGSGVYDASIFSDYAQERDSWRSGRSGQPQHPPPAAMTGARTAGPMGNMVGRESWF